jgi:ABC-type transport system substrate-binding protein
MIDRREINQAMFQGHGVLWTPISPGFGTWAYQEPEKLFGWEVDDATVASNRELARQLWKDVPGYTSPVTFNALTNTKYTNVLNFMQVVQQQLAAFDIILELEMVETAVWFERMGSHDFTITSGTSSVGGAGIDPDEYLSNWWQIGASRNYGNWGSDELDALILAQRFEPDEERRREILWELQELIAEQAWAIAMPNQEGTPWLYWGDTLKDWQRHQAMRDMYGYRFAWLDR